MPATAFPEATVRPLSPAERGLVERHMPLVGYAVSEVRTKVPQHVSLDDLRSAAMVGLTQAARMWDEARGVPFERFASSRIRGAILDELRSTDWASRSVRRRSRDVRAAQEELTASLGRRPTNAELAAHLCLSERELDRLGADVHRSVVIGYESLPCVETAEERLPMTGVSPEVTILEHEKLGYLHDAIATLPDRLRRVVLGYFFEDQPMAVLAAELQVTESRISQLRAEALDLIKAAMEHGLDPVVDLDEPNGRKEKRKAEYYRAVAARRTYQARIEDRPMAFT